MSRPTTIIPIVGVQYAANSKSIAPQTEAERDAHTLALLNRLQTAGGRVMLIAPSNRHNPNAILARYMGMSVGYVSDDYLEVVHRALKKNGGRPLLADITEVVVYEHG